MSLWTRRPVIPPEVERLIADVLRIAELQTSAAVSMAKSVEQLAKLYETTEAPEARPLEDLYEVRELFPPEELDNE